MSRTGTGFEVSTRGGSFFGKKKSSRLWNNDFQIGSSRVSLRSRRFSSGSGPTTCLSGSVSSSGIFSRRASDSRTEKFADPEAVDLDAHTSSTVASKLLPPGHQKRYPILL